MYYYDKKYEVIKQYCEKLNAESNLSFGRNREIVNAILACHMIEEFDYDQREKRQSDLYNILWTENTDSLMRIFSGDEFNVLSTLFGEEWGRKFKKIWDNNSEYIYSTGWERRSFRTKFLDGLYLTTAVEKLNGMLQLVAENFSYKKYFASKDHSFAFNPVIPDLLALEIDENNETVINRIQEIVYGDNNTGMLSHEIIKGVLMSHSDKAHKWIGDLLVAAKLQEGLRQAIVECMDEGSREGFIYLLKVIMDHNLVRFSSVVRALDVWTGLGISAQKPSVVKNCLETAYRCLTEESYAAECLKSNDSLKIYMGLWSIAFEEVISTESKIQELMTSSEKHKRLVALFFLDQLQIPRFQHKHAVALLDNPDNEVNSWVLKNIYSDMPVYHFGEDYSVEILKYHNMDGVCSSENLFEKLHNMLDKMPKKELVFKGSIFPWCDTAISCDDILIKMMMVLTVHPTDNKVDLLLDYRDKMSVNTRQLLISVFLDKPKTVKQKIAMIEFMGDKSSDVRYDALKKVKKLSLSPDDYILIEQLLQYKAGDLRKNAISILLKQKPLELLGSITRLSNAKNENKQLAALDIISKIEKEEKYAEIVDECRGIAVVLSEISQQARILAEKITQSKQETFSATEGFGLFQAKQIISLPEILPPKGFSSESIFSSSIEDIKMILQDFSNLVNQYREFEYEAEYWDGERRKITLGGEYTIRRIGKDDDDDTLSILEDYPLPDVWRGAATKHNLSAVKLLELQFYFNVGQQYYRDNKDWYDKLLKQLFLVKQKEFRDFIENLAYSDHIHTILTAMLNEYSRTEVFVLCRNMVSLIIQKVPKKYFGEAYEKRDTSGYFYDSDYQNTLVDAPEISFWYNEMSAVRDESDEQQFKDIFHLGYFLYKESGFKSHACLQLSDFEKAYELSMVDENELYAELCGRPISAENLSMLTNYEFYNHKDVASCQKLNEVCQKVVDRIVSIELKRGDMTTEVSHLASHIYKCTGTKFFVDILIGAEKDSYVRGYNFVDEDSTKKQIFSHLLKHCYPADGEDEDTLRDLLAKRKVTDKQLIDAAMYSPQWIDIVEKYLNWPGLKSAIWYFHAHINEYFSKDKATIVARFSPISPEDFKDGAFDINWFQDAYSTLGSERFKSV